MAKARLAYRAMCLAIIGVFFLSAAFSAEEEKAVAEPYLSDGDALMYNGRMEDAEKIYEFVLKDDPNNYEALWRLARFYVTRGIGADKAAEKKKEWKKAKGYAERCIALRPDGAEGHLYLAIALGKIAIYSPAAAKVKASWEIKEEAEKAIELDPREQKAYLTLGAWHRKVATASSLERQLAKLFFDELPAGSLEESRELLLKSISLGGTGVRNYYELALTYEAMGNYESARKEYAHALSEDPFYPDDKEIKTRIQKTLRKSRYYN